MTPLNAPCRCTHLYSQHDLPLGPNSHRLGRYCTACPCTSYSPATDSKAADDGTIVADLYCAMCGSSIHIEGAAAETQSPINVWTQVHAHTPKDRYR